MTKRKEREEDFLYAGSLLTGFMVATHETRKKRTKPGFERRK